MASTIGKRILFAATLTGAALASFGLASLIALTAAPPPAKAAACLVDVTHWGKMDADADRAIDNAVYGIDWKLRARIGGVAVSDVEILQCKERSGGLVQCQAQVTANVCGA